MNKNTVRRALFAFTVLYGLLIALLSALDVEALGVVAAVGAVLIGLGWGCSGMLARRGPQS
ncbi:hypothetical protein SAMN05443665_1001168 [Actinomadura meyerae]|uniref:Uncharacterized protein n=1 Tax=Actinomadura meyerae TaxID=240840 RepID=A0A239C3E0_9ACTN|nr:hypothetical protein [Actinomadura meyerae]SNS13883.1 hypothetical protein SAMN05443665_1001168 [Actinomadura meyerae]